jgi:Peptidase family M28
LIDHRLYRLAFVPALLAAIAMLFSLQPAPEPLEAPVTLEGFDGESAVLTARQIARDAPERTPGSAGDAEIADLVTERFGEIASAEVSEQSFSSSFEGEDIEGRNVIATLPGESERRVVLIASRDSVSGPGAASSAAATAVLLELAESFGGSSHTKTLVFVSSAGASDGAVGTREFAEHYPEREQIDSALVVSQPGAGRPQPPFVIPWSAGPQSTADQLARTAAEEVSAELGRPAGKPGTLSELLRLALPTGLGEQSPLIERGIDAVAISSAGERPLSPGEDAIVSLSEETLTGVGQAAQTILIALDAVPGKPEHGPAAYVTVADNLIPGWAIAVLALTLLLPAAAAAADGFARALRRKRARAIDLGWVVGRSLPLLGVLLLVYAAAITGVLPRPRFPYDPGRFEIDWRAVLVLALLLGALAAGWAAARPLSAPRRGDPQGLATATGVVSFASAFGIWVLNPYLSLLAVPAAYAWLGATIDDLPRRLGFSAALVAIALLPPLVALVWLGGQLEVGAAAPWHVVLMLGGRHLDLAVAVLGCVLGGCLVAVLAAALTPERPAPEPRISASGSVPRPDGGTPRGGTIVRKLKEVNRARRLLVDSEADRTPRPGESSHRAPEAQPPPRGSSPR